jgi:hypothetical protein
MFSAGLRFNEPLPLQIHNTMSLGYVQNLLSQEFVAPVEAPSKPEHAIEFNALHDPLPMLLLQPVFNISPLWAQKAVMLLFWDSEQRSSSRTNCISGLNANKRRNEMTDFRKETDSLGEVNFPANRL